MLKYLGYAFFWGLAVILGEVIKWKASEQICLIAKTMWLTFKCWIKGL